LKPNFSDKFCNSLISSFPIFLPNQESSRPPDETLVIMNTKLDEIKSSRYCFASDSHKGANDFRFNFLHRFSKLFF
jgi:hypothetical protein